MGCRDQSKKPLSVLLVGDSPTIRTGWRLFIEESPQIELAGICTQENLNGSLELGDVDAVLLDSSVHQHRCLQSVRILRTECPDLPILVVSSEGDDERKQPINAEQIREAGADGFVILSKLNGDEAIRTVADFFARRVH